MERRYMSNKGEASRQKILIEHSAICYNAIMSVSLSGVLERDRHSLAQWYTIQKLKRPVSRGLKTLRVYMALLNKGCTLEA